MFQLTQRWSTPIIRSWDRENSPGSRRVGVGKWQLRITITDWFSKSFPSLAKLISVLGKTTQRRTAPRTRGWGRGRRPVTLANVGSPEAAQITASSLEDRPLLATAEADQAGPSRVEEAFHDLASSGISQDPVSQELGQARPATFEAELAEQSPEAELAEQSPIGAAPVSEPVDSGNQAVADTENAARTKSMAQMYNTWVELGETISAAQAEMQTLLANRRKSEAVRAEAQDLLDQAEAAWDEAGRQGNAARKAIERGFTVNLPGFAARLRMVDEIEKARLTQTQLRRSTNNEAWEEADRARQKATTELLKALAAIGFAASQSERELREADNLPTIAETLLDSAVEDLRAARSIGDELAHLGREAFSLLAGNDVSVQASGNKPPTPLPITGQSETHPAETGPATNATPDQQDAVDAGGGIEAQGTQAGPETTEANRDVPGTDGADDDNNASEAFGTPPVVAEIVETSSVSAADDLRRELESAGSGGSGTQEAAEHTNTDVEAPVPGSAAEELERELSALRSQLSSPEPRAGRRVRRGGVDRRHAPSLVLTPRSCLRTTPQAGYSAGMN